jgi:DNA-binding LacI/PurR family transcriptional regulator
MMVPDEMPIACFDALSLFVVLEPISASMDQPACRMGEFAMQLLLDRASGSYTGEARDLVMRPTLTVRGSEAQASGNSTHSPADTKRRERLAESLSRDHDVAV